jgi:hypothetical protein
MWSIHFSEITLSLARLAPIYQRSVETSDSYRRRLIVESGMLVRSSRFSISFLFWRVRVKRKRALFFATCSIGSLISETGQTKTHAGTQA